jgi:MFS family permease
MIDELRLGLAPQRSRWGVHCSSVPIGSKEGRGGGQAPASVPTITKRGKDGVRIMAETSLWMRFSCCLCLRAWLLGTNAHRARGGCLVVSSQMVSADVPAWAKRLPCYYGWVILTVSWLCIFTSAPGQTYMVSVFVDPMIHETGWSRNLVAGLYTAGSLMAAPGVLLIGRLFDRCGARITLTLVVLAFGGAIWWMSCITDPVHLFIGFMALRTLGQGSLPMVATTGVAIWFVRKRGRASALTAIAAPASQAIFPVLGHVLITHVGWRNAWMYFALMVWGLLLLPAILLVRRNPEAVGLQPDGDTAPGADKPLSAWYDRVSPAGWRLGDARRTRAFWLLLGSSASVSLVSTALTFHHVALLTSKGFEPALAAAVLSFMAPTALAGSFVAGFLADRVPNRMVLASAVTLFVLAILWLLLLVSPWQAWLYGGLVGFSQGMVMTLNIVIWPNYLGRAHLGSIRGAASTAMVAAAALGPLPFGYVVTLSASYDVAILVFAALPVICIATSLLAVPPATESGPSEVPAAPRS